MPSSPQDDGSESSEGSPEFEMQVESLVAGRERRSTAGTRMNTLIADEEEDDELNLLFAEPGEDEDVEFDEDDADVGSDEQMDSSSDEDQGPAAGPEDLEGEKDIEKEAREERRKKRKAQEVFKRSKPRVPKTTTEQSTGGPTLPAPRPKKKSERVSWLPTPDEGPVRQSSRKQTMKNKEVVHQRMREGENRRVHQLRIMEAAAKRKEATRPKAMTQEDRLAEAAQAEARNAKSLNRWEAAEEKRIEEQKAKIAALKNRTLEGPVISWWSGPAKWKDGKLVSTGKGVLEEVEESREQVEVDGRASVSAFNLEMQVDEDKGVIEASQAVPTTNPGGGVNAKLADGDVEMPDAVSSHPAGTRPSSEHNIKAYVQQVPHENHIATTLPLLPAPAEPPSPKTEIAARNLVILNNIDASAARLPELHDHVLLRRKGQPRPSSERPL